MSSDRDYPDSGILFVNDCKSSERDPDHKGNADITCLHCGTVSAFRLSAWNKVARNASEFLTLSFRAKDATVATTTPAQHDRDIDLPWSRTNG
jgi:hypothetical protein